jgi:DNA-binding CsgD family transcriptional regulator/PAS domain-containing protein
VDAATRAGQVNSVINLEELVPVAQFTASDFYNDYVRPMGDDTCRCLGIRLHNEAGSGYIALQRGLAQSAFEATTASQLNEYLPHVRRMLSIRGKLAAAQHSVAEVTALVDTVGLPMFLVDEDLRLRQVNAAGEELLRASEGLQLRNGMLRAEARHGDEQLRHAVARIFARDGGEATAVGIGAPGGGRLSLTIAPARSAHFRAAIVIADARAGAKCGRAQRLRSLFRLSRGEADLAVMLADGLSPTEIAEERGVAIGTVRVQIKQIAAKLGCSRQSEIVSVVASLPPVYPRR